MPVKKKFKVYAENFDNYAILPTIDFRKPGHHLQQLVASLVGSSTRTAGIQNIFYGQ